MAYSAVSQYQNAQFPNELADVRGFEVRTRDDDDKVGKVSDLVCTTDGQIRYLDVDLGGFFNPRHVALAIDLRRADGEDHVAVGEEAAEVDVEVADLAVGRADEVLDAAHLLVAVARAHLVAADVGELVRELRVLISGDRGIRHVWKPV